MTQEQQEIYDAVMAALQENAKTIADLTLAPALPDLATTFVELSNGQKVSLSVLLGGGLSLYEKTADVVKRVRGTHPQQTAFYDCFKDLGEFSTANEFNDEIDSIGDTADSSEQSKYVGWTRGTFGSNQIWLLTSVINWSSRIYTQMAFGGITVAQGKLAIGSTPAIYGRSRNGNSWTEWSKMA